MAEQNKDTKDSKPKEVVPLILDPCDKPHDAETNRYTDEDGACDEGVN